MLNDITLNISSKSTSIIDIENESCATTTSAPPAASILSSKQLMQLATNIEKKSPSYAEINPTDRLISALEKNILFLENEISQKTSVIHDLIDTINSYQQSLPVKNDREFHSTRHSHHSQVTLAELAPTQNSNVAQHHDTIAIHEQDEVGQDESNTTRELSIKNTKKKKKKKKKQNSDTQEQEDNNGSNDGRNNGSNDGRDNGSNNSNSNKKSSTCIIGDSMLKDIKSWEINKHLKNDHAVVKSFPGAKTTCMEHYLVPSLDQKPNTIILHVGTNDLRGADPPKVISKRIMDLARKCSDMNSKIYVSSLVSRGDNLNHKVEAVNDILEASCNGANIGFIDNSNISTSDLNNSKLHLNRDGSEKLANNLINFLNKF